MSKVLFGMGSSFFAQFLRVCSCHSLVALPGLVGIAEQSPAFFSASESLVLTTKEELYSYNTYIHVIQLP